MRTLIFAAIAAVLCSMSPAQRTTEDCTAAFSGYPAVPDCPDQQTRSQQCINAAENDYYNGYVAFVPDIERACRSWQSVARQTEHLAGLQAEQAVWIEIYEETGSSAALSAASSLATTIGSLQAALTSATAAATAQDAVWQAGMANYAQLYQDAMAACCGSGNAPMAMTVSMPVTADDECDLAVYPGEPVVPLCPEGTTRDPLCEAVARGAYTLAWFENVQPIALDICADQTELAALELERDDLLALLNDLNWALDIALDQCAMGNQSACAEASRLTLLIANTNAELTAVFDQIDLTEFIIGLNLLLIVAEEDDIRDDFLAQMAACCGSGN